MKRVASSIFLFLIINLPTNLLAQQWQTYSWGTQVLSDGVWLDIFDPCPFFSCARIQKFVDFGSSSAYFIGTDPNAVFDFKDEKNGIYTEWRGVHGYGITSDSGSRWVATGSGIHESVVSLHYVHDSISYSINYNDSTGEYSIVRVEKDTTLLTNKWDSLIVLNNPTGGYENLDKILEFINDSTGFILLTDTSGVNSYVLKTTDYGNNWNVNLTDSLGQFQSIFFRDSQKGIATSSNRIYETKDAGVTWSIIPSPSISIGDFNSVNFYNDSVGYLASDSGFVLRTSNRGILWTVEIDSSKKRLSAGAFTIKKIIDEDIAYFKSRFGLYRRSDSTKKSLAINSQYHWQNYNVGNFVISDGVWLGIEEVGIMIPSYFLVKTYNFGLHRFDISKPPIYYFGLYDFKDAQHGIVGGIHVTNDSAKTWRTIGSDTLGLWSNNASLDYIHDSLSYILYHDAQSSRAYFAIIESDTTRIVKDWSGMFPIETYKYFTYGHRNGLGMKFINDSTGFIILNDSSGLDGYILKTIDQGNNWDTVLTDTLSYFRSLYFRDSVNGIVTSENMIMETKDAGLTWSVIPSPKIVVGDFSSVGFYNDSIGYLASDSGFVLRTNNRGKIWTIEIDESASMYGVPSFDIEKIIDADLVYVEDLCGLRRRSKSMIADAGINQVICAGDTVQLGGNPTGPADVTYQWSNSSSLDSSTIANPLAFPVTTTTYEVVVNKGAYSDTALVLVTVNSTVTADAGLDQVICAGDTIQLGAKPTGPIGATYIWSNASSLNSSRVANPLAFPMDTAIYEVVVSSGTCSDTDQVQVIVNPSVVADAGMDQSICRGDTVQIGANPTSSLGVTYQWTNSGSLDSAMISNPRAFPTDTVIYTVTVNSSECSDSDQVIVNVSPPDIADAGLDQIICNGDSVQIGANPSGPIGASYQWTNSGSLDNAMVANPLAKPLDTTIYILTVDNGICLDMDSVIVMVSSPMVDVVIDSNVSCNGGSDGGVTALANGGMSPYTYAWSNGDTPMSMSGLSAATYTVSLTDAIGCVQVDSATIVEPIPVNTNVSLAGNVLTANASSFHSFQWLDCMNGFSPISGAISASYTPPVNGEYAVEVTSDNGCMDTSACFNVLIVGIEEGRNENTKMKLYPNPTRGDITLELGDVVRTGETLFLYSINGQLIDQRRLIHRITKLDLNELERGVYFIQFGEIVKKIVISR